jgi:thiamine transporter ThiT
MLRSQRWFLQELQIIPLYLFVFRNGIAVFVATGWTNGVRFPAEVRYFSLLHIVHIGCGIHPASYTMSTGSSFNGGKVTGAWS